MDLLDGESQLSKHADPPCSAATEIGVVLDLMSPVNAAPLLCAGLLSTLLCPPAALAALRQRGRDGANRQAA